MRQYATATELATYTGTAAPANADVLLQKASRLVDVLLRGVVYDIDADGLPTDTDVADALQTATCAQAALLATLPADDGAAWDTVSIGSLSLSSKRAASGVDIDGVPVAADCLATLRAAGLDQPTVLRR